MTRITAARRSLFNSSGAGWIPDFARSFEQVTAQGYSTVADFKFGTDAPPSGATQIADTTALSTYFNPYSQNANQIVINSEVQRYMPFASGENFVFAPDALELTASLHNPPAFLAPMTAHVVGAVNESNTITVDDASQLKVGQILSIGPENLHCGFIFGLFLAPAAGNTATLTITSVDPTQPDGFSPIKFVYTATGGESHDTVAQWFVDQVNAHATLIANKIRAVKPPTGYGAFFMSWPQRNAVGAPELSAMANGTIAQYAANATYTGSGMQFWVQNRFLAPTILAISGNVLTLSYPVTLAAGQTLSFPQFYLLFRNDNYTGPTNLFHFGDASMATLGQVVSIGWGDTNYHRVTALTSNTITVETSSTYLANGREFKLLQMWQWPVNAAVSNSNVLPFSALPYGAAVGMLCLFPSGNAGNVNTPCYVTAVDATAKTVTISFNVSLANGQLVTFAPPVQSAQIWSKFIMQPGELGRDWIALEWEVDLPRSTDWGAWPALWQFTDTSDPNPTTGSGADEIDLLEIFTYSANEIGPANPKFGWNGFGYTGTPYLYRGVNSTGIVPGNNIAKKTRKFAMLWSVDKVFYYIDGVLVGVIKKKWNTFRRPQFAANLAMGVFAAGSNNGNGFQPIDLAAFPVKFRIKRFRILTTPGNAPINVGVY
jgi:hypothetical protein